MENLFGETIQAIVENNHRSSDILFVGSEDGNFSCSWNEFKRLADRMYNEGYGAQAVAFDLIIVFKDKSKLVRYEYDGAEGWKYIPTFNVPKNPKKILKLFANSVGWESLRQIDEGL